MLRSMDSAISGMQAFQTDLDVVGNNIANVNTVGYKSARADFADIFSQTVSGGTAGSATQGGVNLKQVGLGTKISAINNLFTQGADQTTGVSTDLALQGSGMFCVSPDGKSTDLYYTRAGDFTIDSAGNLVLPDGMIAMGVKIQGTAANATAPATPINITVTTDVKGNPFTPSQNPQVTIGQDGSVNVMGTDNLSHTIAYLSIATFPNYGGLQKTGDSLWLQSTSSGAPSYQTPSTQSATVQSGALESSNVDLTKEFSEMIVAQNGFAANSKMIGTDNQILQTLVNMKNG